MRILYLTPGCFDKGGISRYSRYQIRALQEIYGIESVRTLSMFGPDEHQFEDKFDVFWHGSGNNAKSKAQFGFKAAQLLIQWKPDVLHSAHVNYGGLICLLSKLKTKTATVLNVYGIEVWSNPSAQVRFGMRNVDRIISDCHNTAKYVSAHFRHGAPLEVIWDCVDLERFRYDSSRFDHIRARYKLPDRNQFVSILTLGRLSEDAAYKGYSRLINVFASVHKDHPNVRLIIAGKGNLAGALAEQALKLGVDDSVIFTGSVDEEDLPALYAYADIFSMVTESGKDMGEGLPLTPLEAMACRTPIIVGNQDGSREAIFDDVNGYLIDPFDLEMHARVITDLVVDPEKRAQMAINAERIARTHFSYVSFCEKHRNFYNNVFSRSL